MGLTNRSSQPLAAAMSRLCDDFNLKLRSKAGSRQRWLSSVSLGRTARSLLEEDALQEFAAWINVGA
jgi:hypothetical protein